jgi:hypothetical protein
MEKNQSIIVELMNDCINKYVVSAWLVHNQRHIILC